MPSVSEDTRPQNLVVYVNIMLQTLIFFMLSKTTAVQLPACGEEAKVQSCSCHRLQYLILWSVPASGRIFLSRGIWKFSRLKASTS